MNRLMANINLVKWISVAYFRFQSSATKYYAKASNTLEYKCLIHKISKASNNQPLPKAGSISMSLTMLMENGTCISNRLYSPLKGHNEPIFSRVTILCRKIQQRKSECVCVCMAFQLPELLFLLLLLRVLPVRAKLVPFSVHIVSTIQ